MSKLELDLKKLGHLQQEIEILERKKEEISRDAKKIKNEALEEKRQGEAHLAIQKNDFEIYKNGAERNYKTIEDKFVKREKDLRLREEAGRDIDEEMKILNSRKKAFNAEQKEVERIKSESLDKEHKANLLIEQYKKKIGEVPEKSKVIKKKR